MLTLDSIKRDSIAKLRNAGVETPDVDIRLLIEHSTGFSASDIILRGGERLALEQAAMILSLVDRRIAGEPVDHILGYSEFYGRRFDISGDVLSPRPETEGLVDEALADLKDLETPRILDLGTGSGAILLSILLECSGASGIGTDMSDLALSMARKNATRHHVLDRLSFIKSNWFENVTGQFDLIVSNPPYITDKAMDGLPVEVKTYDPDLALRGGPDGLDPYRTIISQARGYLEPGGALLFEIGFDQGEAVSGLMGCAGFEHIRVIPDLAGHDRIVAGMRR